MLYYQQIFGMGAHWVRLESMLYRGVPRTSVGRVTKRAQTTNANEELALAA
jgi:hypothetical protein